MAATAVIAYCSSYPCIENELSSKSIALWTRSLTIDDPYGFAFLIFFFHNTPHSWFIERPLLDLDLFVSEKS
jgi:hypothetical protein